MNIRKFFSVAVSVLLSVTVLASCGKDAQVKTGNKYVLPAEIKSVNSGIMAENDKIELSWDYDNTCLFVKNKQTGEIWSTIPYDIYSGETEITSNYVRNNLCSTLFVKYVDTENNVEVDLTSNADATYISASKLKTGIRLTYYFEKAQISVPVSYRLEDDGISVSIEVAQISEGKDSIYQVSLLPFFASAENNTDSYLFVPSGSGALMEVDDTVRTARNYNEAVYGEDASNQGAYLNTEREAVRMPVFGVKNKDSSLFAIITEGAETAEINAIAGEQRFGYSSVYTTFNLRGKSEYSLKGSAKENNKVIKYSEEIVNIKAATVRYVLLSGEDNGYNGMAKYYRSHLSKSGMKESTEIPDAMLTFLGGVRIRRLALGIPYNTLSVLTDFEETKSILEDIVAETNASLAVNLKGFGPSGLDSGKYAGKYAASSKFGGKKKLKSLVSWTKEKGIDTFFDFDTIFFNESYKNFKIKNGALSPGDVRAKYYDYTIVVREQETSYYSYLADRYSLATSSKNLVLAARDLGVGGIGLSTLTKTAYSDYSKPEYYCKAHMSNDVTSILSTLKNNKVKSFGESANAYAAVGLDYVFASPTSSSKLYVFDGEIPFYQMVFRGHTALSGATINLAENENKEFLNCMLTGSSLGFTLAESAESEVLTGSHSAIGSSIYSGIKTRIKDYILSAQPLYDALESSEIVSFERNGDTAETVFSNGVKVIANYSDKAVKTELGMLQANSFTFSGKESN